jgi:hypothetical protein
MLSSEAQKWNASQARAVEYHNTEGRALRDIERELRELNSKLAVLLKHLGADAGRRGH